jgi:hypothetical protein
MYRHRYKDIYINCFIIYNFDAAIWYKEVWVMQVKRLKSVLY